MVNTAMEYDNKKIIDLFIESATKAGKFIRDFRKDNDLDVIFKEDSSPVTFADIEANRIISDILSQELADIPIISEESIPNVPLGDNSFILIDPIDGTRSYIKGRDDYSINIALIKGNRPFIGLIYLPEEEKSFYAAYKEGSFLVGNDNKIETLNVNSKSKDNITLTLSPFSKDNVCKYNDMLNYPIGDVKYACSAKKFTLIAEGKADFYPRIGQTGEWDTAAGDILVHEAGGNVHSISGNYIKYGKKNFMNKGFFAYGSNELLK